MPIGPSERGPYREPLRGTPHATRPAMDTPERARLQIRAVHVVFTFEAAALARAGMSDEERREALAPLRRRSLDVLANARAVLDGQAAWHADVVRELDAVRAEIEST